MARPTTIEIYKPDGTPWADGVVTDELIGEVVFDSVLYAGYSQTVTLDDDGQGTMTLITPDSGTAHHVITLPNGRPYDLYVSTGPSTPLLSLLTISGTAVDPDDLQTLLDAAARFSITNVAAEYTVLAKDEYLKCLGSPTPIHLPACVLGVTTPLMIDNKSSVNITVTRSGAATINGSLTLVLYPGDRRTFVCVADDEWSA